MTFLGKVGVGTENIYHSRPLTLPKLEIDLEDRNSPGASPESRSIEQTY